jgi:hypothetical protein
MSKTLLIRQLSGDSQDALEKYKIKHGINTNTEAAMAMMASHHRLVAELNTAKSKLANLESVIDEIRYHYRDHLRSKSRLEDLLSDNNEE